MAEDTAESLVKQLFWKDLQYEDFISAFSNLNDRKIQKVMRNMFTVHGLIAYI